MKQVLLILLVIANAAAGEVRIVGSKAFKATSLRESARVASSLEQFRHELTAAYINEGYFAASINVEAETDTVITISEGRRYSSADLEIVGVDTSIVSTKKIARNSLPVAAEYIEALTRSIARSYADAGFPFCQAALTRVNVAGKGLQLNYQVNTGPRATFGSVAFTGLVASKPAKLIQRTTIREGEPYRESKLRQSQNRLGQLEYTQPVREPLVAHNTRTNAADISFAMRDARTVTFDGLVFLNPDNSVGGSGDVNILNVLGSGERMSLHWARQNEQSSDLALNVNLPFVAGYPFGFDAGLAQSDRDSAFISAKITAGLQFYFNDHLKIGSVFSWEKITPEEGQNSPSARIIGASLTTSYDRRDNIRAPKSGVRVATEFGSLYRRSFAEGGDVSTGYSTLIKANIELWQPAAQKWVLYQSVAPFQIRSDFAPIPVEQLIDVGGPRSVRGYRERSFRADLGVVAATELRWIPTEEFLARVFCDNAYIETESGARKLTGFGVGMSLATTLGTFRLDFSLGEEKQLDRMLAHFGFETGL
ncbi:MAG: POTRA domain-containing protein [Candidatus Zixiibacteriota bacterium]